MLHIQYMSRERSGTKLGPLVVERRHDQLSVRLMYGLLSVAGASIVTSIVVIGSSDRWLSEPWQVALRLLAAIAYLWFGITLVQAIRFGRALTEEERLRLDDELHMFLNARAMRWALAVTLGVAAVIPAVPGSSDWPGALVASVLFAVGCGSLGIARLRS